jgi:hypothetical protein
MKPTTKTFAEEPLVRTEIIAASLGITPATLNYWTRHYPNFPVVRLPGINKFRASAVEAWLRSLPPRSERRAKKSRPEEALL